jgi:hypothetical protein
VPNLADRGCHVVSAMDRHGRNLGFIKCLIHQIEAENMLATGFLLTCLCEAIESISEA